MKKVYISIPISGQDYMAQKAKAYKKAAEISQKGFEVVTPFDVVTDALTPVNKAMGKCIEELLTCDIIYLCEGWVKSKGCTVEWVAAQTYGLRHIQEDSTNPTII